MGILSWDKPKQVRTKDQWENHAGFDGGPAGGYVPNMSDSDNKLWKAKVTGQKLGFPQIEIRKAARGSQLLIIVSLGEGYNYKYYRAVEERYEGKTPADFSYPITQGEIDKRARPLKGINVHVAMNGPAQLTFAEMEEMAEAVREAKYALEAMAITVETADDYPGKVR